MGERVVLSKDELETLQPRVRSAIKDVLGFEEESVVAVSMKNLQKGTTQQDLQGEFLEFLTLLLVITSYNNI